MRTSMLQTTNVLLLLLLLLLPLTINVLLLLLLLLLLLTIRRNGVFWSLVSGSQWTRSEPPF